MKYQRSLHAVVVAAVVFVIGPAVAYACQCGRAGTALETYDSSRTVVITKVRSFTKSDAEWALNGIGSVTMEVVKVYKGNLRSGEEVTFAQGGGADCIWGFDVDDIGQEFLFYLGQPDRETKLWYASGCTRSAKVGNAGMDLLFLNNVNKARGRTRLSGQVEFSGDDDLRSRGIKVRVVGERRTYTLRTDKHGVYEIYDLPSGNYLIEPEIPLGWSVSGPPTYLVPDSDLPVNKPPSPPENQVVVEDRKHTEYNFSLLTDNKIRGTVLGPTGEPIEGAAVSVINAETGKWNEFDDYDSGEDGGFRFWNLRQGKYLIVVNRAAVANPNQPYPPVFYPGTFDRSKAAVLHLNIGETLDDLIIRIPRYSETIVASGTVRSWDGSPVADVTVRFVARDRSRMGWRRIEADTDNEGNFSITLLKGVPGTLTASWWVRGGEFVNCPALEDALNASDAHGVDLRSDIGFIEADAGIHSLVLKFAFPQCSRAKE